MDGLQVLEALRSKSPETLVVLLTAYGTVEDAVEAMKLGAEDFLEKPVDMKVLLEKISEAKHKHMLILEKKSREEVENILRSKSW